MPIIGLRAVGELDTAILAALLTPLTATFGLEVQIGTALPHPDYAYDAERRQYLTTPILEQLRAARQPDERHILGVFDGDLYAPRLNFAFGEASRADHTALIGLARLYPFEPDKSRPYSEAEAALFSRRVVIEAIHELGHSYGLSHCANRRCVMHFSNSLAETDYKQPRFCARCHLKIATKSPLSHHAFPADPYATPTP
jgi:archaemetzincin